jgi:hypothetical protein
VTLDEAEAVAREWLTEYQSKHSVHVMSNEFARILLAVLPVVKAAEVVGKYMREGRMTGRIDWACAECAPHEEIPPRLAGFRCAHHGLLAALSHLHATTEGP